MKLKHARIQALINLLAEAVERRASCTHHPEYLCEERTMSTPLKITRLDANQADFNHHLDGLLAWEGVSDKAVNERVDEIIAAVGQRGDAAVDENTAPVYGMRVTDWAS